jgi:hypothetical protein
MDDDWSGGLNHLMAPFQEPRPSIFMVVLKISKRHECNSNLGWVMCVVRVLYPGFIFLI